MFFKLPFAASFSDLFITIQYTVFRKSIRTFYISLNIYIYKHIDDAYSHSSRKKVKCFQRFNS